MNLGLSKLRNITFYHLYIISMMFMLISVEMLFDNAAIFQNMLFVYAIMFLYFARNTNIAKQPIFQDVRKTFILSFIFIFLFAVLPVGVVASPLEFSSPWVAVLWFVVVVGFTETIVFSIVLPQKLGAFTASLTFAVLHIATYMYIAETTGMSLLPMLIQAFFANLVFIYIYRKTNSAFLVALVHGLFDLKKLGILAIILGGLI